MSMTEETQIQGNENTEAEVTTAEVETSAEGTDAPAAKRGRPERGERGERREKPKKEFDEILLEVRRVTRVNTG